MRGSATWQLARESELHIFAPLSPCFVDPCSVLIFCIYCCPMFAASDPTLELQCAAGQAA